ncbi:MAG: M16 family metallopeptidase [Thermoplasmata archaeon]
MRTTTSPTDPLRLEYGDGPDGLRVARQYPPAGAASFSATYVGPAGWGFDPPGEAGLARLVNHLLTSATGRFDRVALARRLDRAGATLSRDVNPESAEVTIWGPAEDWEPLLGLLGEVVRTPRFDPDDLARVRRQFLERQLRERTQPASRAELELLRTVFPEGHPYRETGLGDRRSLARLTRGRLRHFHRDHYTSDGGLVVVTAAAPMRSISRAVERRFAELPTSGGPRLALPSLSPASSKRRTVDLPGRSQVEVRLGGPSIPQDAPDYPAAYLANQVLGGRPLLARLFQRVREKNGLAYHASSHLESMRLGGIWSAQAGTGADRWRQVVPMLEEEVERLRTERVPGRELGSVRESAIGEIPLALESTADAHGLAVDVAYHELPADFWLTWPARLRAVTPQEVLRAAERAFERNRSVTVVAGPVGPGG